ncbi:alpha/beta hydrolase [Aliirhizobium terrae]|uniref:alpha/beta hydrolase n=1 Tax=Terrirhizobium terrae TaxID=2926709 RepID=UPI00257501F4|nr:alpha/beta hydrolase [Rhizobium sp. CC-CFT758]WJH40819.1 alpha/beta hydrolase [Rhizobium sp. CC-CFT758]
MTTLNLVHPEQRDMVAGFFSFDADQHGLEDFRSVMVDGLGALMTPVPVEFEVQTIPGPSGVSDIRTLIHRPEEEWGEAAVPAILYLHGGGMIAGTAEMMAGAHRKLAQETGALVVAPNYRLAPEAPFPAGLEDCYAALTWLHAHAAELGVDADRIIVMGDSGGGGLAAALALLARDRGEVPLKAQVLVYPMLDIRTGTTAAPSDDPLTGEFVVNRALITFAWEQVRGTGALDDSQARYLSPALAPDLEALPPALIVTGALDLFRDEDIAYSQRLLRSGVPTDLQLYAGAVHGFDMLPGELATDARTSLLSGIRRLLK